MPKQQIEHFLKIINEKYHKFINFDVILVTGTYGKTTTSHYLNLLIQKLTNIKIGLFSKPHIINITERIRINYNPIPQEIFEKYKTFVENINNENNIGLNWFDELVATAILYFIDEKVELAIFEIGIGGLNDSTNSINSIINIITNISLEHTDILGKTIKKIAEQKAGIIKNKSIVITNTSKGLNIIKDKCNQTNSDLYILKKSVKIKKISSNFPHYTYRIKIDNKYYTLKFQSYYLVENFSIALLASLIYSKNIIKNINLENKDLQEIINSLNVPLKMQIFKHKNKEIIIDTAKDYSSLMKLFKELLKNQKDFDVILSFSKGKEIKLIKKIFLLLINNNIRIYLTEHSIEEKKMRINKLMENLNKIMSENEKNKLIKHVEIIPQIKDTESLYDILEKTNKNHIVITGSLYFVSEIYNLLKETPIKNK